MSLFNVLLIIFIIFVLILLFLWAKYNSFIKVRNQVKTDFADIDVQIKRRASLIENLVEVVKGYAKHEKSTFENVAKARSQLEKASNPHESAQGDNLLTQAAHSLFAISERYPDLKASDNFQRLQQDLKETENLIASYREEYNKSVLTYNTTIQIFPNLLVSNLFGFKEEELFQPEPSDRKEIKLKNV